MVWCHDITLETACITRQFLLEVHDKAPSVRVSLSSSALLGTKLAFPQSKIIFCPMKQLKHIALYRDWAESWNYKCLVTDRLWHTNFYFSFFSQFAERYLSPSWMDNNYLCFEGKLTSFLRVWSSAAVLLLVRSEAASLKLFQTELAKISPVCYASPYQGSLETSTNPRPSLLFSFAARSTKSPWKGVDTDWPYIDTGRSWSTRLGVWRMQYTISLEWG